MTIAEASKQFGITSDTLRYYERIGLLPPVTRSKSGIRDYSEEDLKWIEFIKCMRSAGIGIEALIEYVKLFFQGDSTIEARENILKEQRELLVEKINITQGTLARLDQKISWYGENIKAFDKEFNKNNKK